jgi:ATP-dependent RNA helicase DeaD
LIDIHDLKLGIVFCNTKRMVDDLVDHLNAQGYSADRLHGDMSQAMRDRVMGKFRKSGLEFLVATDVAARGIDVEDVQVVFNYDLPYDVEDYVHRIGRTGRAGRSGRAISFVAGRELFQIQQIERYTRMKIQRMKPPTAIEVEEARSTAFVDKLRGTLQRGEYRRHDHLVERLLEEGFSSTDIASALIHELQQDGVPAIAKRTDANERSAAPEQGDRNPRPRRHEPGPRRYDDAPREPRFERPKSVDKGLRQRPVKPTAPVVVPPAPPREIKPAQTVETPQPQQPKPFPFPVRQRPEISRPPVVKHSRRTPEDQTRLYMNVGSAMGVAAGDVVNAILGETGLSKDMVGAIDVRERHTFVDVASEHTSSIVSKLNRARLREHKLKVKVA